jgi:hypothetical protein
MGRPNGLDGHADVECGRKVLGVDSRVGERRAAGDIDRTTWIE